MRIKTKKALLWASALCALGIVIFLVTMLSLNWRFSALNSAYSEEKTHALTEPIKSITVTDNTANLAIRPSSDGEARLVTQEGKNLTYEVSVADGTLTVTRCDTRAWYQSIFNFGSTYLVLYLPAGEYEALNIKTSTGDIFLAQDFTFSTLTVKATTADISCRASVKNDLNVRVRTGDIELSGLTAGDMNLSVTTGDILISAVRCTSLTTAGDTGDLDMEDIIATGAIHIERTTGDVSFSACDASEIFIRCSTGDIEGTLLTSKLFHTDTNTGDVRVPTSEQNGGACYLKTTTGDIHISIAP